MRVKIGKAGEKNEGRRRRARVGEAASWWKSEEVGGKVPPCHAAQLDIVSGVARLR